MQSGRAPTILLAFFAALPPHSSHDLPAILEPDRLMLTSEGRTYSAYNVPWVPAPIVTTVDPHTHTHGTRTRALRPAVLQSGPGRSEKSLECLDRGWVLARRDGASSCALHRCVAIVGVGMLHCYLLHSS